MKRAYPAVIVAVLILLVSNVYADQDTEMIRNAMVKIRTKIPENGFTARALGTEREGSGIIIDEKGLVLTIGYLIIEAESIEVVGPKGRTVSATFIGYDFDTGFGLVRMDRSFRARPVELGDSSKAKEGDQLIVASYGGSDAIQATWVVSRREFTGYWEYLLEDALYTSPPHPGFGGAALIDQDGRLLGIGSIFTQLMVNGLGTIPCNMFVPIDLLKPILSQLIDSGRTRKPSRPWLGLNANVSHDRVFIIRVTPEGPAEQAGIRPGDIILSVEEKEIRDLADFYRKVWALGKAGVKVRLEVLQGTKIREITIQSADRYQFLLMEPKRKKGTMVYLKLPSYLKSLRLPLPG
jgi:S1-C subfamily serine protease